MRVALIDTNDDSQIVGWYLYSFEKEAIEEIDDGEDCAHPDQRHFGFLQRV